MLTDGGVGGEAVCVVNGAAEKLLAVCSIVFP